MQTFLPYPDIFDSLQCLDNKRLGKQRVEAKQILTILTTKRWVPESFRVLYSQGWANHPAVKMWEGWEILLAKYYNVSIHVWTGRGFMNNMPMIELSQWPHINDVGTVSLPDWWGGEIHETHRSNLLRKDWSYYSQYDWSEPDDLDYYWPTEDE